MPAIGADDDFPASVQGREFGMFDMQGGAQILELGMGGVGKKKQGRENPIP